MNAFLSDVIFLVYQILLGKSDVEGWGAFLKVMTNIQDFLFFKNVSIFCSLTDGVISGPS